MNKDYKFIKEAYEGKHGSICQEWKDTILKHYPEFKQEGFKVGYWIVNKHYPSDYIGKITLIKEDKFYYCGHDYVHDIRKATKEEILSHLSKETGNEDNLKHN